MTPLAIIHIAFAASETIPNIGIVVVLCILFDSLP